MSDMEEENVEGEMGYDQQPEGEVELSPGIEDEQPLIEDEQIVPGMPEDLDDNLMEGVQPDQS